VVAAADTVVAADTVAAVVFTAAVAATAVIANFSHFRAEKEGSGSLIGALFVCHPAILMAASRFSLLLHFDLADQPR
jgi:hypothetical protein